MILFLDDEKWWLESYLEELEETVQQVVFISQADEALKFFEQNKGQIKLLILDVMMPSGDDLSDEPDNGLRMGIHFYDKVRETDKTLPVIIFTNVSDESVEERFNNEDNCWFIQKEEVLPFQLADKVKQILSRQIGGGNE
jgi:CheY-like chemotaxis protein